MVNVFEVASAVLFLKRMDSLCFSTKMKTVYRKMRYLIYWMCSLSKLKIGNTGFTPEYLVTKKLFGGQQK